MFGRVSNKLENYDKSAQTLWKVQTEEEIKEKWKQLFVYIYSNINDRVQEVKKLKERKFNKKNDITAFNVGDLVIYMTKAFADTNKRENKFNEI